MNSYIEVEGTDDERAFGIKQAPEASNVPDMETISYDDLVELSGEAEEIVQDGRPVTYDEFRQFIGGDADAQFNIIWGPKQQLTILSRV